MPEATEAILDRETDDKKDYDSFEPQNFLRCSRWVHIRGKGCREDRCGREEQEIEERSKRSDETEYGIRPYSSRIGPSI